MALQTVQNPEVGRVYLVRRKINGRMADRYEPAFIKARWFHEGSIDTFAGWRLNVFWLNDNSEGLNVLEVDGTVKSLTKRWLTQETERASLALSEAQKKYDALLRLRADVVI